MATVSYRNDVSSAHHKPEEHRSHGSFCKSDSGMRALQPIRPVPRRQ